MFRSHSETLKAAVQYITGGTLAQSFGSPARGQSHYDAAGSLEILSEVLEAMRGEMRCTADDFQNLVVLHQTASFELRVPILRTALAAYGLTSAVGHLARLMARDTPPRAGSLTLTRRVLVDALSDLVFEAEGSAVSRRELPGVLVGNLAAFLGCLRDSDAQVQTALVGIFTCAGVDIFDALLSLACSKVHGCSVGAPLELLLRCLAMDFDPQTRELALVCFLHLRSGFKRVVRDSHDEERLLVAIAGVVRDERQLETRLLALTTLDKLRAHTPCFVAGVVDVLTDAARKDKSEELRQQAAQLLKAVGFVEMSLPSPGPKNMVSRVQKDHQLYVLEAIASVGGERCSAAVIHVHIQKHYPTIHVSFEAIKTILKSLEEKKVVSKTAATYRIRK